MKQRRVLLFCHDATGLGHLKRITRIAKMLQGPFACLIVTGMEQASWVVPQECEVVKLPNWDGMIRARAERHNRPLWLTSGPSDAYELKSQMLLSVGLAFRPDAVLVDYLPFGLRDELRLLFQHVSGRRYLIHRGLVDLADRDVLFGAATADIAAAYDRIVVTADRRIVDVASEYGFVPEARAKTQYVGYVNPADLPLSRPDCPERMTRPLVVCACGGGFGGEQVFTACIDEARRLPEYYFHVVLGSHGSLPSYISNDVPPNCELHQVCPQLELLHRTASVVITHGGYNSVTEAMSGGARVLVRHIQGDDNDERINFERRLASYYPIRALTTLTDLHDQIAAEMALAASGRPEPCPLDFNGLVNLRRVLCEDLRVRNVAKSAVGAPERTLLVHAEREAET